MPRVSRAAFRLARSLNKLLPPLLPVSRDLSSARSELRWLEERANETCLNPIDARNRLLDDVRRRSRHEPLQYILGSEFFSDLEIKCRPGVLIPRHETATAVSHLARILSRQLAASSRPDNLRVIDLCTGTGCIPLLFHHDFYKVEANQSTKLQLVGVDISPKALRLARENRQIQIDFDSEIILNRSQALQELTFLEADVLAHKSSPSSTGALPLSAALQDWITSDRTSKFDVLVSNPPYISGHAFRRTASRSVRHYEPRLALVPPHLTNYIANSSQPSVQDGDAFYPRLLDVADELGVQVVLLEVGDIDQAVRVANMAVRKSSWDYIEIWRDEPEGGIEEEIELCGVTVVVKGKGHGRSVFARRGDFATA